MGGSDPKSITIGIGMWLGIIMAYNVWMIIWPNQKKALGIIDSNLQQMKKPNQQKLLCLFSRTNTSIIDTNVTFYGYCPKPFLISLLISSSEI